MRAFLFANVVATLATSASVCAQPAAEHDRHVSLGIAVGMDRASGSLIGIDKPGITIDADVQYRRSESRFALRAGLGYHTFPKYPTVCAFQNCSYQGLWSQITSGSIDLVAYVNPSGHHWSPYILVGAAANSTTGPTNWSAPEYDRLHGGWETGLGVEVHPWKQTVFVEGRYLSLPFGGVVPVTLGVRF